MDNSIRDMGDLLQIKNEIDKKLPRFDVEKVLISLSENCGADQLQYSMEQEFYKFEQMYLTKCEMEINMTPLGQNNYTELKDAFEYELNDIRNKVQEIPQTEEWNKLVRLVQEKENLNKKICNINNIINSTKTPKDIPENNEVNWMLGGVAVIGIIIIACMVDQGGLESATCFIVPTILIITYLISAFAYKLKVKQDNDEYDRKIDQRNSFDRDKNDIDSHIRNIIADIVHKICENDNINGSGGIIY